MLRKATEAAEALILQVKADSQNKFLRMALSAETAFVRSLRSGAIVADRSQRKVAGTCLFWHGQARLLVAAARR
jgi:hypothetical protein